MVESYPKMVEAINLDLPQLIEYEEIAIDLIVNIINKAKDKLGVRRNLFELASSRDEYVHTKISLAGLVPPLAISCEKLIEETIVKKWQLTDTFAYFIRFVDTSEDESKRYYYYEVIFSQPTVRYPVPQATVNVYFRVSVQHIDPLGSQKVPMMIFRLEGQNMEYDVRYVGLTADWILAMLQMKIKMFQRIESYMLF